MEISKVVIEVWVRPWLVKSGRIPEMVEKVVRQQPPQKRDGVE